MLNQIIRLAHSQDFKRFSILLSNGVRYNVRTRDHISVPPIDEEEKPDFFFVWTDHAYRIVSLANVAAIEAQRDFWLASADLDAALIGGGAGRGESTAGATASSANASADE